MDRQIDCVKYFMLCDPRNESDGMSGQLGVSDKFCHHYRPCLNYHVRTALISGLAKTSPHRWGLGVKAVSCLSSRERLVLGFDKEKGPQMGGGGFGTLSCWPLQPQMGG